MKKILFLLLLTIASYGQTIPPDATPIENIQITNNVQNDTLTKVGMFTQDGVLDYMPATSLPVSTATQTAIDAKVGDFINDGATTLAPSMNAVYDALQTKENVSNKSDSYTVSSSTTYASTKAVVDGLATKLNGSSYTTTPTATAFTQYFGNTGDDVIKPKTLSDVRTEIVTTAAVNAARPNIITGTGTGNTIPIFTSTGSIGNSLITYNGLVYNSSAEFRIQGITTGSPNTNSVRYGGGLGGSANTFIGIASGNDNSSGTNNASLGYNSLQRNLTGSRNLAAGALAASTVVASNITQVDDSVFLGYNARPLNATGDVNELVVGFNAIGLGSNTSVFGNSSTSFGRWWGNLLVGTSTNNGNAGRFAGTVDVNKLQLNTTPATAIGTPPLLTWNSTTKDVESVPYAAFAPTASPAFTGTPTAPTAAAGTNSTQIATTEFVNTANSGIWTTQKTSTATKVFQVNSTGSYTAGIALKVENNYNYGGNYGLEASCYSGGQGVARFTHNGTGGGTNNLTLVNTSSAGNNLVLDNNGSGTYSINSRASGVSNFTVSTSGVVTSSAIVSNGTIRLKSYTVATLPAGTQGDTAYVTDAVLPTYLGTLTGGGSVVCPVFYNGTTWVSH